MHPPGRPCRTQFTRREYPVVHYHKKPRAHRKAATHARLTVAAMLSMKLKQMNVAAACTYELSLLGSPPYPIVWSTSRSACAAEAFRKIHRRACNRHVFLSVVTLEAVPQRGWHA
eukprot:364902-Chlamydomonas_euryale.AAC.17